MMDAHLLESLYVRFRHRRRDVKSPVRWSSEDVRLLGCRFGDMVTIQSPAAADDDDRAKGKKGGALVLWNKEAELGSKVQYIQKVLTAKRRYVLFKDDNPFLRLGQREINTIPFSLFLSRKQHPATANAPMIGYTDYRGICRERFAQARRYQQRHRLPLATVIPIARDWSADPYVLCLLLSMAQSAYETDPSNAKRDAYRPCLLLTSNYDVGIMYMYQATIPSALLDQLSDISIKPQQPIQLVIHRRRISIKPYEGLEARIWAALSSWGASQDGGAVDGQAPTDANSDKEPSAVEDGVPSAAIFV